MIRAELDVVIQHYKDEEGKRMEKEMLDEIRSHNAMSREDTNDTKSRSHKGTWKRKLVGEPEDEFD